MKLATVAITLFLAAPVIMAQCTPANPSDVEDIAGPWQAASERGSKVDLFIQASPKPAVQMTIVKMVDADTVVVDQAPDANEIALGALTGQSVPAWTAFSYDQEHPKEELQMCGNTLVLRVWHSVPPPRAGALYIKETLTRFEFEGNPPALVSTEHFWTESHPESMLRMTLARPPGFATGLFGGCSSFTGCMQTPGYGALVAATGGLMAFFALMFGSSMEDFSAPQLEGSLIRSSDSQDLPDSYQPPPPTEVPPEEISIRKNVNQFGFYSQYPGERTEQEFPDVPEGEKYDPVRASEQTGEENNQSESFDSPPEAP